MTKGTFKKDKTSLQSYERTFTKQVVYLSQFKCVFGQKFIFSISYYFFFIIYLFIYFLIGYLLKPFPLFEASTGTVTGHQVMSSNYEVRRVEKKKYSSEVGIIREAQRPPNKINK